MGGSRGDTSAAHFEFDARYFLACESGLRCEVCGDVTSGDTNTIRYAHARH